MGSTHSQSEPCLETNDEINKQSYINERATELPLYKPPTNDELCLSHFYVDGVNTTIFQFINYFVNSTISMELFIPYDIISLCSKYLDSVYPLCISKSRAACDDSTIEEINGIDKNEMIYENISRGNINVIASRPMLKIVVLKNMYIYQQLQLRSTSDIPTTFIFHVMGDIMINEVKCYNQKHNIYIICHQTLHFQSHSVWNGSGWSSSTQSGIRTHHGQIYIKCKQLEISNFSVLTTNDTEDTKNTFGNIYIDVENDAKFGSTEMMMQSAGITIIANNIRIGTNSYINACIGNMELIARNKLSICAYSKLVGKQILLKYKVLQQGNDCVFKGVVTKVNHKSL
eukprot:316555_1